MFTIACSRCDASVSVPPGRNVVTCRKCGLTVDLAATVRIRPPPPRVSPWLIGAIAAAVLVVGVTAGLFAYRAVMGRTGGGTVSLPSVPSLPGATVRLPATCPAHGSLVIDGATYDGTSSPVPAAVMVYDGCDLTVKNSHLHAKIGIEVLGNGKVHVSQSSIDSTGPAISGSNDMQLDVSDSMLTSTSIAIKANANAVVSIARSQVHGATGGVGFDADGHLTIGDSSVTGIDSFAVTGGANSTFVLTSKVAIHGGHLGVAVGAASTLDLGNAAVSVSDAKAIGVSAGGNARIHGAGCTVSGEIGVQLATAPQALDLSTCQIGGLTYIAGRPSAKPPVVTAP